jgi:fatty acid synthase
LSIGKLYELGVNPSIEKLYPKVEWPVARNTQSISSLIKWDHKENYFIRKYPEFHFRATASDMNISLDISIRDDSYLKDHCIDGKVLFPATGYLMLAWRRLASCYGKYWSDLPVVFEDVQIRRPIFLSESEKTKITIRLLESTGRSCYRNHCLLDILIITNFFSNKNIHFKDRIRYINLKVRIFLHSI